MVDWTPADLEAHLDGGHSVFLKLWKKGCGACKLSKPAVERLMAQDTHGVVFGQICTDDYPEILELSQSEVLPAFFIFIDKKMRGKLLGFKGLAKLQAFYEGSF